MPKKKKTRAQKITSDQRRETMHTPLYSLPQNIPTTQSKRVEGLIQTATISITSYTYLGADLRKTFFVTFLIIVVEALIKYLFKGI